MLTLWRLRQVLLLTPGPKEGKASREELAETAAHVLTTMDHENKRYVLTSTESSSSDDVARQLSSTMGKQILYQSPSVAEFQAALKQAGVPELCIGMFTT